MASALAFAPGCALQQGWATWGLQEPLTGDPLMGSPPMDVTRRVRQVGYVLGQVPLWVTSLPITMLVNQALFRVVEHPLPPSYMTLLGPLPGLMTGSVLCAPVALVEFPFAKLRERAARAR